MVLGPGFGDAFLELSATGTREGAPSRLLRRAGRAKEVCVFVQQRGERLAVLNEDRERLLLSRMQVHLPQRIEDALAVQVQRAVPVREAENFTDRFDHLPVPRSLTGAGHLDRHLPTARQ
ncbi:hypothetical protein E0H75_04680 [Kribbella capetownensis]|uniref:Uncharacterized protein n=1 Tax=Kribbella capetownensis TaxID=1572659 RepID=A0A4R0K2X4_9ACTN|nr:hypothetical protein E0H75_04680 [Kribbella capetownensis]